MPQKIIPNLQPRSEVTDGLNFPSDDGIQSYRVSAQQLKDYILANGNIVLAMLASNIFNGLSAVSPADDDYFPLVDTSDSNSTKKALLSNFIRKNYNSVTSYPSSATGAGTYRLSGSSGTFTLPTPDSVSPGRRFRIIHAGTSLTQVYALAVSGSSAFKTATGDVASGSYSLYTKGEMVELEDDGTNYNVVGRHTNTGPNAFTFTIGAVTTAPTHPSDAVATGFWFRNGSRMKAIYQYNNTASTGGAAGSGNYLWPLPANMPNIDIANWGSSTGSLANGVCGIGRCANSFDGILVAQIYDATRFRVAITSTSNNSNFLGSGGGALNTANRSYVVEVEFPIVGWQP